MLVKVCFYGKTFTKSVKVFLFFRKKGGGLEEIRRRFRKDEMLI
jgi:hypothetical protein